jgi:hypothetical protein
MSLTVRYLVVRSNGTFERVSRRFMCELQEEDSALYLPEFAGRRLRYAEAILEVSDVQYPEIARLSYGTVPIDHTDTVDFPMNAAARRARIAQAFRRASPEGAPGGNVIFAQEAFILASATWQPSCAQQQQIQAIFTNEQRAKRFRPARLKVREVVPASEATDRLDLRR